MTRERGRVAGGLSARGEADRKRASKSAVTPGERAPQSGMRPGALTSRLLDESALRRETAAGKSVFVTFQPRSLRWQNYC